MPDIRENYEQWNNTYSWSDEGHQWSEQWGTASAQWYGTILPRIYPLVPTDSIVEIAPGFGRWTEFLLPLTRNYVGIDISDRAIKHCQEKFRKTRTARFVVGSGADLPSVPDGSTSFVFSFDSLVHVEMDCLDAYAKEVHRVLKPGGFAFLHHSNMAEYSPGGALAIPNPGWRGTSVNAERAKAAFNAAGLKSHAHEKITWVFENYTDCFSLVQKPVCGASVSSTDTIFYNPRFAEEYKTANLLSSKYQDRRGGKAPSRTPLGLIKRLTKAFQAG